MITVEPIDHDDFDNLEQLRYAVEDQGLDPIIATRAAFTKYESMLFDEEQLHKFVEKINVK
jgi:hypothetical protein